MKLCSRVAMFVEVGNLGLIVFSSSPSISHFPLRNAPRRRPGKELPRVSMMGLDSTASAHRDFCPNGILLPLKWLGAQVPPS